ncbi:MAG: hypothetical protein ACP5QG_08880 [candidate division WOR-3 bacterium]
MKKLIAGLLLIGFLTGCATVIVEAPMGAENTVSLTSKPSGGSSQHFTVQKKVWYVLWGLVPITNNSTDDMISQVSQGGKDVRNMKVTVQYTLIDWLIGACLGGISIMTNTVTVEGDVVK